MANDQSDTPRNRDDDSLIAGRAQLLDSLAAGLDADSSTAVARLGEFDHETRLILARQLACLRELREANAPSGAAVESGHTLGRFEIRRRLGLGGQGIVFLAYDPALKRELAVKVPLPETLASAHARDRFLNEAQVLASLRHPNIVAIHDVGAILDGCYIASEYCSGPNLADWRRRLSRPLEARIAARLVKWIAAGVAEAHRHNIIHRDLKPANVLLDFHEGAGVSGDDLPFVPKVTDFGLARSTDKDHQHTQTGAPLGTPAYMAPEQAEGRRDAVGPATDVYALGVMLFELLTSELPHQGKSYPDTLRRIVYEPVVSVRRIRRDVPSDLAAVCMKCLEKQPEKRYPDASALKEDLRRFLNGEATVARPLRWPQRAARWAARRPALASLAVVSIASALLIFVGSLWYSARLAAALADSNRAAQRAAAETRRSERLRYGISVKAASQPLFEGRAEHAARLLEPYERSASNRWLFGPEWGLVQNLRHNYTLLADHQTEAFCVALSPDGRTLVSGDGSGRMLVVDPRTGRQLNELRGHKACVNEVCFSPDGQMLASAGCDGQALLWDAKTWTARPLVTQTDEVHCVEFSPDGRRLAVATRHRDLQIVDLRDGKTLQIPWGNLRTPNTLAWHPAGRLLAAAAWENDFRVCDAESGETVHSTNHCFYSMAFTEDGSRLLCAHATDLIDWNTSDWSAETRDVPLFARSLALHPDGDRLAIGGEENTLLLTRWTNDTSDTIAAGHLGRVTDLVYSRDGQFLYSASIDGRIRRWAPDAQNSPLELDDGGTDIQRFCFGDSERQLVAYDKDGGLWTWDVPTGKLLRRASVPSPARHFWNILTIGPDRVAVVIEPGKHLQRVDIDSGKVLRTLRGHFSRGIASRGGRILVFGPSNELWLADRELTSIRPVAPATLSFDGWTALTDDPSPRLIGNHAAQLHAVEIETGRIVWTSPYASHVGALSRDGKRIAVTHRSRATLQSVSDGRILSTISTDSQEKYPVAFNCNGTRLATAGHNCIRIWDLETLQELIALPTGDKVEGLCFSDNDRYLAASVATGLGTYRIHLWDCGQNANRVAGKALP